MGKAKLGVLLVGAYAFGLAVLLVVTLALPCGTLSRVRPALAAVPQHAQRVLQLARVAIHAGALGLRHLPEVLGPQGRAPDEKPVAVPVRYCLLPRPGTLLVGTAPPRPLGPVLGTRPVGPRVVRVVITANPG